MLYKCAERFVGIELTAVRYPQRPFPYEQIIRENAARDREVAEYEITDTDAFEDDRYWDVFVEYAKDEDCAEGVSMRITAYNRGPEPANLHIIPQAFFRNTWACVQLFRRAD